MKMRFGKMGRVLGAAALVTVMAALPAGATPKDADGEHKVTICHVTNSETNPYVMITVDVAAWDGHGANDHTHHVSKDGRVDFEATRGDCTRGTVQG